MLPGGRSGRTVRYQNGGTPGDCIQQDGEADPEERGKNAVSRNLSNSGMARKKDTSTIVVILTGDTRRFAEAIARKLGIDWVRAKLAREGKVSAIADLQAKAGRSLWWAMGSTTLRARPGRRRNGDRRRRAALRGCLYYLTLTVGDAYISPSVAGWSSLVARWAHNPKVEGSNPSPATTS